ncbi:MAG: tRNA (guanine(10)-N(2))-dimethyltransferase [Nanoarchaeota archaeon]|nr:tRNA (guanine(10)-N(2))-dimethyltransferase [Nanoarchaeota archaeon]
MIKEGKAVLDVKTEKIVSKKMDVFYNPVMKFNRDISVLLLNCIDKRNLQIGLPLAGSGIRGVRFLLELRKGKIKSIRFNDYDKKAVNSIKKNLKLNKIKLNKKIIVENKDANLFLLESHGFDYIDIDPFGSPNPYLDSSVRRISREGILAVTATDTAALTGTYIKTCLRKYWAVPLKNELMHEIGLRILIRKIQLIGAQYEKALIPIFSYFKDHYFRVFFRCEKGRKKADSVLEQHGMFDNAGPLWLGGLWDKRLVNLMEKKNDIEENKKILRIIKEESRIDVVGFYDITKLAKKYKIKVLPKQDELIAKIKKKGFKASPTHFRENSVRSDVKEKEFVGLVKVMG